MNYKRIISLLTIIAVFGFIAVGLRPVEEDSGSSQLLGSITHNSVVAVEKGFFDQRD